MVRLELMRLNTAPALDPALLTDVSSLSSRSSAELRELGRLPEPIIKRKGDRGFRVISWDEAEERIAAESAACRSRAGGLHLPHLARHHQRGLLRGAEGRSLPRDQPCRQTRRASVMPRQPPA